MSFTMHGVAVSGGIAIGFSHLVSHATLEVPHYALPKELLKEEIVTSASSVENAPNGMFFARMLFASSEEFRLSVGAGQFLLLLSPQSLCLSACNSPRISFVLEQ